MERRRYGREFKLEAVKLVRERGVSVAHLPRSMARALYADPMSRSQISEE
jgi:transposase-like protein